MEVFITTFPNLSAGVIIALAGLVGFSFRRMFSGLEGSITTLSQNIKTLDGNLTGFNTRLSTLEGEHKVNHQCRGH